MHFNSFVYLPCNSIFMLRAMKLQRPGPKGLSPAQNNSMCFFECFVCYCAYVNMHMCVVIFGLFHRLLIL